MHSKSDNIEIMINDEADEVIKEPSESVFDYVHLLYYKCYKISPNHCG